MVDMGVKQFRFFHLVIQCASCLENLAITTSKEKRFHILLKLMTRAQPTATALEGWQLHVLTLS